MADRGAKITGAVQSVDRTFQILEAVADEGGQTSLSRLAETTALPMPTIHRLMRTLAQLGYVRQDSSRQYSLGPRLIRLGEAATAGLGRWARPHMAPVADKVGESVNLAVLDHDQVLYIGQEMAHRNSMRIFTEVGRRVPVHATAVGKAMLADFDPATVRDLLLRTGMRRFTNHTLTAPEDFAKALEDVRRLGYAVDEGEQEVGVRCVAVAVHDAPQPMALSISAPSARLDDETLLRAVPLLRNAADAVSASLREGASGVA